MKTLVVYYSLTGNTRKIALKIAKNLGADLDEIIDKKNYGDKAMGKKDLEIDFKKDPSKYDLVVIGSPVWGFGHCPFARLYMKKNNFKQVAFFCTYALWTGLHFFNMKRFSKRPKAMLKIHMKSVDKSDDKIDAFCEKLR